MRPCPIVPIAETTACGEPDVSPRLNAETAVFGMIPPQFNFKLIFIPPMVGI